VSAIPVSDLPKPTNWRLDAGRINDLQQESLVALVKRCKQAHFTNVQVRINGQWETYEADWIKNLLPEGSGAPIHRSTGEA
jgi:hypothetical protein